MVWFSVPCMKIPTTNLFKLNQLLTVASLYIYTKILPINMGCSRKC